MINQTFKDIYSDKLAEGALIHDVFEGFKEDYLILHCLLRKFKPKSIFEVGTNIGSGINVMATAVPDAQIFSLDLDYKTMQKNSKQYPINADGTDRVGTAATFPYTQLRGNSLKFKYDKYPCEAAYIDGEHDYQHPLHESREMFRLRTKLVIWHDADMYEVAKAIKDAWNDYQSEYELYRVTDTRIAYAVKK